MRYYNPQIVFGLLFGFGGKVQILASEDVKNQYKQMITNANDEMNK